jgi:hypothetical protein
MGGELELVGTERQPFALFQGEVVKVYYETGDLYWTGTVQQGTRELGGYTHRYALEGPIRELQGVTLGAVLGWGTEGTDGDGVREALEDLVAIVHAAAPLIGDSLAGIEIAAGERDLTELAAEADTPIDQLLDQLAVLASSDGQYWVWGIDENWELYFRPISTAEADVQARVAVGLDALTAREQGRGRQRDKVQVVGGLMRGAAGGGQAGHIAKWTFTRAGAPAAARRTRVMVPTLRRKADMETFAAGWLARYALPELTIEGARRVEGVGGVDSPPRPWLGQASYEDTQRGVVAQTWMSSVTATLGTVFEAEATLGKEDALGNGDSYAPAAEGGDEGGGDPIIDALPEVTDEDPPDGEDWEGSPPFNDPEGNGGDGLSAAQIIQVYVDPVVRPSATISWLVQIDTGGTPAAEIEVRAVWEVRDDTDGTIESTGSAVASVLHEDGNVATYQATLTAPAAVAWLRSRVKVQKPGTADPVVYWWWPDDETNLLRTRVDDGSGGTGGGENYYVGIAHLDPEN